MITFNLYLANTRGQKISGFHLVTAASFKEAVALLRVTLDAKGIDRASTEVLAAR